MSLPHQTHDNDIPYCLTFPPQHHRASTFYKRINAALSTDCKNLKILWEKGTGCVFEEEEWTKTISNTGKFIRECKGKLTQYKIVYRYYWTPVRLNRMGLMNSLCWKCQNDSGTLMHCLWECPVISRFW